MKKLLFTLFCATTSVFAMAQNYTITGTVIDGNSNPVANHTIYIYTDSITFNYYNTVTTDVNGNYSDVVPNGAQVGPLVEFYVVTDDNCNPITTLSTTLNNGQGTISSGVANFTVCSNAPACLADYTIIDSANTGNLYFQNTSTGTNLTYSWDFGDGNTSTVQSPWHQYAPGGYFVCLTITNGNCSDTRCDSIFIGNQSPNCTASFYATNNGNGTYNFYDFSSMNPTTWHWDFGDGNTSTLQNPAHTYTTTGTYTVCLTASNGNCTSTYCNTYNYTGTCQAEFYAFQDSINSIIYLIDLSQGGSGLQYFWDFGDGNTSTLQYPTHTYANSGFYSVCLTITDNSSCTSTYCDSLGFTLFGGPNSHQNGFTINVIPASSVGVDEVLEVLTDMNVYPNPANENATLEYNVTEGGNHSIIVTDITGKVVMNENYNAQKGNNRLNLNLNSIESGMYLITVADANGHQSTLRITKQ